jgi:hypothetical protein
MGCIAKGTSWWRVYLTHGSMGCLGGVYRGGYALSPRRHCLLGDTMPPKEALLARGAYTPGEALPFWRHPPKASNTSPGRVCLPKEAMFPGECIIFSGRGPGSFSDSHMFHEVDQNTTVNYNTNIHTTIITTHRQQLNKQHKQTNKTQNNTTINTLGVGGSVCDVVFIVIIMFSIIDASHG